MMFQILVAVLILIALIIVILPLWKKTVDETKEISREDQNIVIAKAKLAELKQQLESGDIDESQFTIAKDDLESALALDLENQKIVASHQGGRWLIVILVIALPLASSSIYLKLGNPDLLDPEAKLAAVQKTTKKAKNMSMTEVVEVIKKRLTENPEDAEGWYILGRTFMSMQKYPEAQTAYKRAYELVGDEPNIMLSLADSIAMTKKGKMTGEPERLVRKALDIEPNNEIALWLAGLAAEQSNRIPEAYGLWSKLLPLLSENPQSYNEIKTMLSEFKDTFPDLPPLPFAQDKTELASQSASTQQAAMMQVKLSISIDPTIREQLSGKEQVFVYAKAVTGPPMPLAARKFKVSDLPVKVTLSDADAMMPQLKLSSVSAFTVGARVSMSGNPIPRKGDFYMEVSPLDKTTIDKEIVLTINKVVN